MLMPSSRSPHFPLWKSGASASQHQRVLRTIQGSKLSGQEKATPTRMPAWPQATSDNCLAAGKSNSGSLTSARGLSRFRIARSYHVKNPFLASELDCPWFHSQSGCLWRPEGARLGRKTNTTLCNVPLPHSTACVSSSSSMLSNEEVVKRTLGCDLRHLTVPSAHLQGWFDTTSLTRPFIRYLNVRTSTPG